MHSLKPLLSVIVPARDEAENLPHLLDEIALALEGFEYEVIVIDDGSVDRTWSLLTARASGDRRLRPLRHPLSAGQSTSLWQAAARARGAWLATLDGDGQNDPADIPRLLERAQQGDVTLVAGYRKSRRDDWLKRLSSRVANRVRSALLADGTPDTGCGLKLIDRSAFLALPYFDHMHRFLPALVQAQGGVCVSVPVRHRPRLAGRSHYGVNNRLWVGLVDLVGVMWLRRRSRLPAPIDEAKPPVVALRDTAPLESGSGRIAPPGMQPGRALKAVRGTGDEPRGELLQRDLLHGREV
jgi:dolichol-phosphate mannosyltransferase